MKRLEKQVGIWMKTKKELVTTTDTVVKEGNTDTITKPNVVKEAITPPI